MVLCNSGKPPCRKASWARPMHNSTGTTLHGQEACGSVPTASSPKPLLVVKSALKMLEDTPQVGVRRGSRLWCNICQECCSHVTRGSVALSFFLFHNRASWRPPRESGILCLAPEHPAFCDSVTPLLFPIRLPLGARNQSQLLLGQQGFPVVLHYLEKQSHCSWDQSISTNLQESHFMGFSQPCNAQSLSLSWEAGAGAVDHCPAWPR